MSVVVIGLDCAPPALVFDRLRGSLPTLDALIRRGAHGPLRSVMPPITMPAWACMLSGRDPGELGIYGFRKRIAGGYGLAMSDARDVTVPRVWDVLGAAGKRVSVLYVPPTSPPPAVHGELVSCFLTASPDQPHTHPQSLGAELRARFGAHAPDIEDPAAAPDAFFDALYRTTEQHFAVARERWTQTRPDFAMLVEMGTDRLHHAMWMHLDPSHPAHDPSSPWVREARDYYAFIDAQIGAIVDRIDLQRDTILIVSDHGARALRGTFAINAWLRDNGWLAVHEGAIDWSRTRAWGEAGYYARVFFNVEGREPHGIVAPADLDAEVTRLARELESIAAPPGGWTGVRAHRPRDLYRAVRGVAPELLVVLDDLGYRAIAPLEGPLFADRDPTRPDGCNHDWDGVFIAAGAGVRARGLLEGLSIFDVGPTILALSGVEVPDGWLGEDRSRG